MKTLHIFPHSGGLIPPELEEVLEKNVSKDQIQETIEINRDTGLWNIRDYIKANYPEHEIVQFEYARVCLDANRIVPAQQIPDTPYKGVKFFTADDKLKNQLSKKYIHSWLRNLVDKVHKTNYTHIVIWHSMDEFGGGNHNQIIDKKDVRPLGQIITRVDCEASDLKLFFPEIDEEIVENKLVSKEFAESFTGRMTGSLSKYSKHDRNDFAVDEPYKLYGKKPDKSRIFAPSLCNIIDMACGSKINTQIAVELRKDLAENHLATKDIVETLLSILY